jgi:hypothetical protein
MKFYTHIIAGSALFLLISVNASSQDQQTQQETQTATTTQEVQSPASSQVNATAEQTEAPATFVPKLKPFADELSIADQFAYAIDKSSNFQDYKVIKQTWISKLKINTLDTLSYLKSDLNVTKTLLKNKTELIDSMQTELNLMQAEIRKKNSFGFLGIMVSKTAYDGIMWAIIAGLIVCLGIMLGAFRRSFSVTAQTKKDLNDVKEEFELYRKKALKSKEEAVRQLHDELNKFKNKK